MSARRPVAARKKHKTKLRYRSLVKPERRLSKTHTGSVKDRACWYKIKRPPEISGGFFLRWKAVGDLMFRDALRAPQHEGKGRAPFPPNIRGRGRKAPSRLKEGEARLEGGGQTFSRATAPIYPHSNGFRPWRRDGSMRLYGRGRPAGRISTARPPDSWWSAASILPSGVGPSRLRARHA